jgi:hypothetical protein
VSKDLAASVRARLLNLAKAEGSDFNGVLVRYALERLLYRMCLPDEACLKQSRDGGSWGSGGRSLRELNDHSAILLSARTTETVPKANLNCFNLRVLDFIRSSKVC